jgi:hypothetical protein
MPPPKDLWRTFVEKSDRPGFPFNGWENVLGDKRCFHLPGFTEVCEQLGLNNRRDFEGRKPKIPLKKLIKLTLEALPPEWLDAFGNGNDRQEQEWRDIGLAQLMICYKRQPMLLQKAALSLIFLEQVVIYIEDERRKAGELPILKAGFDVYTEIRIHPAVYFVDGFDKKFHKQHLHSDSTFGSVRDGSRFEALRRLKKETGQEKGVVFEEIALGNRTCLYKTAKGIIAALGHEQFIGSKPKCGGVTTRSNGTPSKSEIAEFKGKIPLRSRQG